MARIRKRRKTVGRFIRAGSFEAVKIQLFRKLYVNINITNQQGIEMIRLYDHVYLIVIDSSQDQAVSKIILLQTIKCIASIKPTGSMLVVHKI
jgi:hypothetical protein